MTLVSWVSKNSRAIGKITLYGAGGVLMGAPAIDFGTKVYNGIPVQAAADVALQNGFGVSLSGGPINTTKLRNGAIRTGLGVGACLIAKKL